MSDRLIARCGACGGIAFEFARPVSGEFTTYTICRGNDCRTMTTLRVGSSGVTVVSATGTRIRPGKSFYVRGPVPAPGRAYAFS